MIELIDFIKAENAKSQAEMDANPGTFIGMLAESFEWWNEQGIHTIEDFKRWEMEAVMSNLAKEAYGTRSMCPDTRNMTFNELEVAYDDLCKAAEQAYLESKAAQELCVKQFESKLVELQAAGAGDRETALRWLRDAEDNEYMDDGYFEYTFNLPYGYLTVEAVI